MAKVTATEIRAGNLIEWEKRVWRVLKSYHVHVGGRGGAFMQIEMKDIESGTKKNERIRTEDKIERAFVEPAGDAVSLQRRRAATYSWTRRASSSSPCTPIFSRGRPGYLIPNIDVQVNFYQRAPDRRAAAAERRCLTVTETEPNLKSATATGSFKPAKTETGLTVMVPQFIVDGTKIKVNTDTGEYIERA